MCQSLEQAGINHLRWLHPHQKHGWTKTSYETFAEAVSSYLSNHPELWDPQYAWKSIGWPMQLVGKEGGLEKLPSRSLEKLLHSWQIQGLAWKSQSLSQAMGLEKSMSERAAWAWKSLCKCACVRLQLFKTKLPIDSYVCVSLQPHSNKQQPCTGKLQAWKSLQPKRFF